MTLFRQAAALLAILLACGCATPERRLDVAVVKTFAVGSSTRADVERVFGRPNDAASDPAGHTAAHYYFRQLLINNEANAYHRSLHPADMLFRSLSFVYSTNGVVVQKLHDETVTPVNRLPTGWLEVGQPLEQADVARRVERNMPAQTLDDRLGKPMGRQLDPAGKTELIWVYYRFRTDHLGSEQLRFLQVLVNKDQQVLDYRLVDLDPRRVFQR